jgi:hypothetical protein
MYPIFVALEYDLNTGEQDILLVTPNIQEAEDFFYGWEPWDRFYRLEIQQWDEAEYGEVILQSSEWETVT